MSFKNQCCRVWLTGLLGAQTGDSAECPNCHNEFVHDGNNWRNRLELGQHKIEKLRRIRFANQIAEPSLASAPHSPNTDPF